MRIFQSSRLRVKFRDSLQNVCEGPSGCFSPLWQSVLASFPCTETQTLINLNYGSPPAPPVSPSIVSGRLLQMYLYPSAAPHTQSKTTFSRVYGSLMKTVIMIMDILKRSVCLRWARATAAACASRSEQGQPSIINLRNRLRGRDMTGIASFPFTSRLRTE